MEAAALQKIEELVLAAAGNLTPENKIALLPLGCTVADLEKYLPAPARMRQMFSTSRIDDFLGYVNANQSDSSTVYVRPDGSSAHAIIDHGSIAYPEWGQHQASLVLEKTRAFSALELLASKPRSQQDLIDFLEDWAKDGYVDCLVNGETVPASRAIAAIRKVEIKASASSTHSQGDFNVSRSAMDEIDVRGAAEKMPSHFVLMSPVYVGLDRREIYCRIGITGEEGKPQFRLRMMKIEAIHEETAKEVEKRLREALPETPVFVGTVNR